MTMISDEKRLTVKSAIVSNYHWNYFLIEEKIDWFVLKSALQKSLIIKRVSLYFITNQMKSNKYTLLNKTETIYKD